MISVACYQHTLTHTQPLSKAGMNGWGSHQISPEHLAGAGCGGRPCLSLVLSSFLPSVRAIFCRPSLTRNWDPSQAHSLGSPLAVLTTIWPLPWSARSSGSSAQQSDSFSGCGLLCPPQDNAYPKACGRARGHPAGGPAWTLGLCLCQAGFFLGLFLCLYPALYFYYLYTEQK